MVLIMALAIPAMNSLKGAGDVTKAVYDIKGVLDQARTYAIANNTYTWVGFFEEDGSKNSATPAVPGTGRVVVATVASKSGTRGYDLTNPASLIASNLTPIGKLQRFDNIHMAPLFSSLPNSGGLSRPTITGGTGGTFYIIGSDACQSKTPFCWPVGATAQYTFIRVLYFDPQGIARIQSAQQDDIALYMEIGIQPVRGNVVKSDNNAAIQIDGMTGATRIYRP